MYECGWRCVLFAERNGGAVIDGLWNNLCDPVDRLCRTDWLRGGYECDWLHRREANGESYRILLDGRDRILAAEIQFDCVCA